MPPKKKGQEPSGDEEYQEDVEVQISFRDLEKSMNIFTGDDTYPVTEFIEEFENVADLMKWTNVEKLVYAKRLLGGTAKLFLRSVGRVKDYTNLKKALKEEFGPKLNSATIHKRLVARKMKSDETYQQYFLTMKEIALHGKVEDVALMEYVIDGIRDIETNKAILYGAADIKEFRKKLEIYSEFKKKEAKPTPSTSNYQGNRRSANVENPKRRCYNCGAFDHQSSACEKGIKCFGCNEFGHKGFDCPNKPKKTLHILKEGKEDVPFKKIKIEGMEMLTLFDTGSDVNLMTRKEYEKIKGNVKTYKDTKIRLTGIAEKEIFTQGLFTSKIQIDDCCSDIMFYVVDDNDIPVNTIIGNPILRDFEVKFTKDGISMEKIEHLTLIVEKDDKIVEYDIEDSCIQTTEIKNMIEDYKPTEEIKKSNVELRILLTETTARLKKAQDEDEHIQLLKIILQKEPYQNYILQNDILYKERNGDKLFVVPKKMQNEIIRKNHERGHFGIAKTEELINREYFIENLQTKIKKVIDNCVECILVSHKRGKKEGLLNPINKGDVPLATYHIDHLGPLTSTNKNYKYILTVVDAFTKFTWIYPVKTLTTEETLSKLSLQQQVFGSPERLITDRNAAFTSNDFEEYCQNENITHYLITTGQPRGNGQVERIHQIIIGVLSKLSADDPTKWYRKVPVVQRCLNGTYQRSIGMTPFELMFGVKMRDRDDELVKIIEEEYIERMNEKRQELREKAKESIKKIQEENIKTYNKKRREATTYEIGDLVAIKKTQFSQGSKLYPKFLGPYEIVKKNRNDRYGMKKIGNTEGPNNTTSSADFMKPWIVTEDEDISSGTDE